MCPECFFYLSLKSFYVHGVLEVVKVLKVSTTYVGNTFTCVPVVF